MSNCNLDSNKAYLKRINAQLIREIQKIQVEYKIKDGLNISFAQASKIYTRRKKGG